MTRSANVPPVDDPTAELDRLRAEVAGYKAAYEQVASELVGYKAAYEQSASEAVGYREAWERTSIEAAGYRVAYERTSWLLEREKHFLEDSRPLPRPFPQVGFLHVMKTAGSSLLGLFQPRFEELRTLWVWHPSELEEVSPRQVACFDFVTGHYSYAAIRKFRNDRILFTFLRHPVHRVLSSYWFFRTFPGDARIGVNERLLEAAKKYSLIDFLKCDDPQVRSNNQDHQTHALAEDFRQEHRVKDDVALDLARRHLADFAVVGLTERSEESSELICRRMGWDYHPLERRNVTPNRQGLQDLSTAERDAIEERNQLDLQLYALAVERLERETKANRGNAA